MSAELHRPTLKVPMAVVGMDFREGPTTVRARLKEIDDAPDGPSASLRKAGQADGVVRIESCSRVEWVVSAANPAWAAELMRGALLTRLGELGVGRRMHLKVSTGALHYLMRVTLGLESVAEGEHAIGRQVLKAFEYAHAADTTDKTLHLTWHALGRMLQARKNTGVASSVGIQSLVKGELQGLSKHDEVLVFGLGDIGRSVLGSLKQDGFSKVEGCQRKELGSFITRATRAAAVVVCTGGPVPWVMMPERTDGPLLIDVGAPAQVADAPGWKHLELDELLTRRGLTLDLEALDTLNAMVDSGTEALIEALTHADRHVVLEALETEKRKFFDEGAEAKLADLTPREAKRVTELLRGFTHRMLEVTRKGARAV
jgi:glutamyl-tRNA reductase